MLIDQKNSEFVLNKICGKLSVTAFRSNEVAFMAEYLSVMYPLAMAVDTLQSEDQCFMGVLLPTLSSLRARLSSIRPSLKSAGYSLMRLLLELQNALVIWKIAMISFLPVCHIQNLNFDGSRPMLQEFVPNC